VQLQEKNKDVVSISLNVEHKDPSSPPPQELTDKIVATLKEKNVTCDNVIASDGINNVLAKYEFTNGLPAVLIYGRDGKLRKSQDAGFEYEKDVEPTVAELLEE
jgi:hypothetical protein